jgi:hypothetical protein
VNEPSLIAPYPDPPAAILTMGKTRGMDNGLRALAEVEGDPFALGPWCWLLAWARRIRPVLFKGQVGLFNLPDQLVLPPRRCRTSPALVNESRLKRDHPDPPGDG